MLASQLGWAPSACISADSRNMPATVPSAAAIIR